MPQFSAQLFQNNALFFTVRRKIDMAAFARQADPALINVHQMGYAQPGSGAINGDRFAGYRRAAAELNQVLSFQHRDGH